jgi:hypothetical protein
MKYQINKFKRGFIRNISDRNLEPAEEILFDGKPHEYWVRVNGEYEQASYSATPYPFEDDPEGPALVGWYGLIDHGKQYTYSSSKPK